MLLLFCRSREGLKFHKTFAVPIRAFADNDEPDKALNLNAQNEGLCCDWPEDDERP